MLLEDRVRNGAEAAIQKQKHVSAVDVVLHLGWVNESDWKAWRRGDPLAFEAYIQTNPDKVAKALRFFHEWAKQKGLEVSEIPATVRTREGVRPLQFTLIGDPAEESAYRISYLAPGLPQTRQKALQQKLSEPADLVAFRVTQEGVCAECGGKIHKGDLLVKESKIVLCMRCADLDHLVYLPSGDAALTRRSKKYSALSAVVVEFSRSRSRYERQGLLVTEEGLRKAEEECLSDEEQRSARRERDAERRVGQDEVLQERMKQRILELYPAIPMEEADAIAQHTSQRGSGRVGRSAAGRALDDGALRLAVRASVRHNHTPYDQLLMAGTDRQDAREQVAARIDEVIEGWAAPPR